MQVQVIQKDGSSIALASNAGAGAVEGIGAGTVLFVQVTVEVK